MDERRHAKDALARFCAEQRSEFDSAAWLDRCRVDGPLVGAAAAYLSMTSWYGHAEELARIAASNESRSIDFDLVRFSVQVRYGIASWQARRRQGH